MCVRVIIFMFAFWSSVSIQLDAQVITTICGNGMIANTGDGGPASAASVYIPSGGCFDKAGNYYFVVGVGHRIRMISTSGTISTVAGTGTAGFDGDGGLATNAKLNMPFDVIVDTLGNVYISDSYNFRIRKVAFNPLCEPITNVNTLKARDENLTIYPNPSLTTITIVVDNAIKVISIINYLGELVYEQQNVNKEKVEIDITQLPQGMYIVKVNGAYTQQFLKE